MRGWAVRPQERQAGSFGVGASGGADYRDGAVGRRVQLAAEGTDPRGIGHHRSLDVDLTDRQSGIKVPTLVVGGDRDAAYGAGLFRETAEGLPHGQLLLYSRTGHVGVQARRRFVPDVLRFLS
jgi:pimeloyl-ACP methyl ester carboxylesterase